MLFKVFELSYLDRGPFSFSLDAGECVGLSGPSGIGKSQLLRALTDLMPAHGRIELEGQDCASIPAPAWRRMVTMVAAEPAWWFDTVGEHFEGNGDSQDIARRIKLFDFPPEVLSWQVQRLSTGEKQRLGLLRSLQNTPKVLLLDEPTSALDKRHTEIIETFIAGLRETAGMAVLWVSHDPDQLARVATRVLHMEIAALTEMLDWGELGREGR